MLDYVQQDLASAELHRLQRPSAGIAAGGSLAAIADRLVARRHVGVTARVDRDDHALAAELIGDLGDQGRPHQRCRVQRDLVGAGAGVGAHALDVADLAADSERNEAAPGKAFDDLFEASEVRIDLGDLQHEDLVDSPCVKKIHRRESAADIVGRLEAPGLHHVAVVDEQRRDQPMLLDTAHAVTCRNVSRSFMPPSCDFSG